MPMMAPRGWPQSANNNSAIEVTRSIAEKLPPGSQAVRAYAAMTSVAQAVERAFAASFYRLQLRRR